MTGTLSDTTGPPRQVRSSGRAKGVALIGHTGFVGGNLSMQVRPDGEYNSTNIGEIAGKSFDLLICAGVRAVKWWANQNAAMDRESILVLLGQLRQVQSREVIVISTVDVYPNPIGVDESTPLGSQANHPYGTNRLFFEAEMKDLFPKVRVIRLPALFGPGLKKNVIYDLVHDHNLESVHPDSTFQYYDVTRLWQHTQMIRDLDLDLVNLATEPITTESMRARFFPSRRIGAKAAAAAAYDMRTRHAAALGGRGFYVASKEEVLKDLGAYVADSEILT